MKSWLVITRLTVLELRQMIKISTKLVLKASSHFRASFPFCHIYLSSIDIKKSYWSCQKTSSFERQMIQITKKSLNSHHYERGWTNMAEDMQEKLCQTVLNQARTLGGTQNKVQK